jgi:hypothetical protein
MKANAAPAKSGVLFQGIKSSIVAMQLHLQSLSGKLLPCFPCGGGKRPTTPHGFQDATCCPIKFAKLCSIYPGRLIGVPTGETSGLDILDVDP